MLASGKATFAELDSVLSVEDLYLMLEVLTVEHHNQKAAEAARERG